MRLIKWLGRNLITFILIGAIILAYLRVSQNWKIQLEEFRDRLADGQPTLIFFYSQNCPHCHDVAPAVAELQQVIRVLGVDVDTKIGRALMKEWRVNAVPTLILIDTGLEDPHLREVDRQVGAPLDTERLITILGEVLSE